MIFIILAFLLTMTAGGSWLFWDETWGKALEARSGRKEQKALPPGAQGYTYSWASKQLLAMNEKLPPEHRIDDLHRVLHALDVKHTIEHVNEHFSERTQEYSNYEYYWKYHASWEEWNCHGRCPLGKYKEIKEGIENIHEALAVQEHQVAVSAVADDLKRVDTVIADLNREVDFISDTTLAITTGH